MLQLQHCMNTLSILFFLCLSLPIDGTGWGATFGQWGATDWLALVGLSTVAYLGSGMFMQVGLCARAWREAGERGGSLGAAGSSSWLL